MSDDHPEVESAGNGGIQFGYIDGQPVWQIPVDGVETFRGSEISLDFQVFGMPSGALIAFWLQLHTGGYKPAYLHELFDISNAEQVDYLQRICDDGQLTVLLLGANEQHLTCKLIPNTELLGELLERSKQYNAQLQQLDGAVAVSDFLKTFAEVLENQDDVGVAWQAVVNSIEAAQAPPGQIGETFVDVFVMPTGVVVGCWLTIDWGDGQRVFVERAIDLSEAGTAEMLSGAAAASAIVFNVDHGQTGEPHECTIPINGPKLSALLRDGLSYLRKISYVNGKRAVREFTSASKTQRQKHDDLAQAWTALRDAVHARTISSLKWSARITIGLQHAYYWFARSLQLIAAIPKVGAWIVTLIVPMFVMIPLVYFLRLLGSPDADFDEKLCVMLILLSMTIWTGYLDQANIVRITMPLIPIPLWAIGIFSTLGALLSLFF